MNETEVRALLIRGTEDRPPGLDLMAAVPAAKAQRQHRRIRVLIPLGAAAAVAVAVSVLVLGLPVGQRSAQAQVAAAVETTSQQSYRIHSTSGNRAFDGAFDPVRHVGIITNVGGSGETRFIGDVIYVRAQDGSTWEVAPRMDVADAPLGIAVIKLFAIDPVQTLQRLRSATDIREDGPASGDGWTGKRFTFSLADLGDNKPRDATRMITGAVDVDDQDRIRRLQVSFTDSDERIVTEFSDFGVTVTVAAPPAGELQQEPRTKPSAGNASDKAAEDKRNGSTAGPGTK